MAEVVLHHKLTNAEGRCHLGGYRQCRPNSELRTKVIRHQQHVESERLRLTCLLAPLLA
jgi:hypothetical protein